MNNIIKTIKLLGEAKSWSECEEIHAKASLKAINSPEVKKVYENLKKVFKHG